MLYTYAVRFDITENFKKFLNFGCNYGPAHAEVAHA